MNKVEFLNALRRELKALDARETEEIINDFEEHFAYKMNDGYSEEEIAKKLGSPKELAVQFTGEYKTGERAGGNRVLMAVGMILLDILVALGAVVLFAWLAVMAAFTLASLVLGGALILNVDVMGVIPHIPRFGGMLAGCSFIALSVLSAVGTWYYLHFMLQLSRAYRSWHKRTLSGAPSMPLPKHPVFSGKTRRVMRGVALVSLLLFGVFFVIGTIALMFSAGSIEFWHTWNWFR